jgi:hypothetical protein
LHIILLALQDFEQKVRSYAATLHSLTGAQLSAIHTFCH